MKTIAGVSVVSSVYGQHVHAPEPLFQINKAAAHEPAFFSKEELGVLAALVDVIIPRTDTPGASDAGVHHIIDSGMKTADESRKKEWRGTIAWANGEAQNGGGNRFPELSKERQSAILLKAAAEKPGTAAHNHFQLIRSVTIDIYYSTREGLMRELGWNANTYLSEFKGCTHPEHQA